MPVQSFRWGIHQKKKKTYEMYGVYADLPLQVSAFAEFIE